MDKRWAGKVIRLLYRKDLDTARRIRRLKSKYPGKHGAVPVTERGDKLEKNLTTQGTVPYCLRQGEACQTKFNQSKYQDIDSNCTSYGDMQPKSIKHVLECKGLNLTPLKGETDLAGGLGFRVVCGLMDLARVMRA